MACHQSHHRKFPLHITICRTVKERDRHPVACMHLIRHALALLHIIDIKGTIVDHITTLRKPFGVKLPFQHGKILTFMVKIRRIHTRDADRIIVPLVLSGKTAPGIHAPFLFHAVHISLPVTGQLPFSCNLSPRQIIIITAPEDQPVRLCPGRIGNPEIFHKLLLSDLLHQLITNGLIRLFRPEFDRFLHYPEIRAVVLRRMHLHRIPHRDCIHHQKQNTA